MEKLSLSGTTKHSTDDVMRGLSVVLVDGQDVFIDNGAIHAKSRVERNIRWVKALEEVPNPRTVYGVWITLHRFEGGVQGYYGAMSFTLHIDSEAQVGYKSLAEQVNGMERAVKGMVSVETLPEDVRLRLGAFVAGVRPELWEHAHLAFREAFQPT